MILPDCSTFKNYNLNKDEPALNPPDNNLSRFHRKIDTYSKITKNKPRILMYEMYLVTYV